MIDLGHWFKESYKVPSKEVPAELEEEEDENENKNSKDQSDY
jgi:endogenous inhibitor of DNA gyrase (YacG/DUF329 family)